MKNFVILLLIVVAVLEALALRRGYAAARQPQAQQAVAGTSPGEERVLRSADSIDKDIAELRQANARLNARLMEIAHAMMSPKPAAAAADAADAERRLNDLIAARKIAETSVPFVRSSDGTLSPEFAEFYGLNADEHSRLSTALKDASEAEKRLDDQHTSVAAIDENAVEIVRTAYPEAGGAIHDRLAGEFKDVLGASRYESFLALSGGAAAGPFGPLGTRESKWTVRWKPETRRYHITEEHPGITGVGKAEATMDTLSGIDGMFPGLAPLIPAALQAKAEVSAP